MTKFETISADAAPSQMDEDRTIYSDLKIYAISMIRNEADLIVPILNQAKALFDCFMVVDVQSSDGTSEIISEYKNTVWPNIQHYTFVYQEKYQGALMNVLAARAVAEGADWIFLLDGDEFLNVKSREELQRYLKRFPHDVMSMPWINLVPTVYGDFENFDAAQTFRWRGRVHPQNKIALSASFLRKHPGFNVQEGNHHVARELEMEGPDWDNHMGIPLLHVPVRSPDRLRYKIAKALATLKSKHNRREGEGFHVMKIAEALEATSSRNDRLNAIAAFYSMDDETTDSIDVDALGWPSKTLPDYCTSHILARRPSRSMRETMRLDETIHWETSEFIKGSVVQAKIQGDIITLSPQPISGGRQLIRADYGEQPMAAETPTLDAGRLSRGLQAAMLQPAFSGRVGAVGPAAAAAGLFALVSPQRYVELGASDGDAFLHACQVANHLNTHTQCIAIDDWQESIELSRAPETPVGSFLLHLRENYPWQHVLRAKLDAARQCFGDR